MKHALVALLLLAGSLRAAAQKHYFYTDAGLCLDYGGNPGLSATYNYNPAKHIGIGAGVQGYMWHTGVTNPRQFTPALFADFRFLIRARHISQYFILTDLGMDFYKHSDDYAPSGGYVYSVPNDNGVYFGLGLGYFRRLTRRGWGAYFTMKAVNNFHKENRVQLTTGDVQSQTIGDGTLVLSLGFRFGDEAKGPAAKAKRRK